MHTLRTRFKKDIVAEFLPALSWSKGRRLKRVNEAKNVKVVILCGGMPGTPRHRELVEFLAKKNYWVFYPRYRGSWESGGTFLKLSPEQDVLDIVDELPKGFEYMTVGGIMTVGTVKKFKILPSAIYVVGGSFGGPAAILVSRDPRITKAVAISPVVEWRAPSKAEPLAWLEKFTRYGFGNGYRFSHKEWAKLKGGKFYNPMPRWREIDGKKLLIYHAKDDKSVRWNEVVRFAKLTGVKLMLRKTGGHLSSTMITAPGEWRRVSKFLRSR